MDCDAWTNEIFHGECQGNSLRSVNAVPPVRLSTFFMGGRIAEYVTADATTRHEDVTVECRAVKSMPGRMADSV